MKHLAEQFEMPMEVPTAQIRCLVLASGSKANCVALQAGQSLFLIDCGLPAGRTINYMHQLGLNPMDLDAILITHEHGDHVAGLKGMLDKTGAIPVASSGTVKALQAAKQFPVIYLDQFPTTLGKGSCDHVSVNSFQVPHDAMDPVGYVIGYNGTKVGYVTDAGYLTEHMVDSLRGVDLLFVEANHDDRMLEASQRHASVNRRVASGHGHLPNTGAAILIEELAKHGLKKAVLMHLSADCNDPEVAMRACRCDGVEVLVEKFGLEVRI